MRQQKFILLDLLTFEVGNQIPSDDASYAWRIPASSTPLRDPINLQAVVKSKMKDRYWVKFNTSWNVKERVEVWSCIVWVHSYISSVKYVFLQKCYLSLYRSCSFWNSPPSGSGFRICFPGIKRPGRGVDHLPFSRAEVEYGTAVRTRQPCRKVRQSHCYEASLFLSRSPFRRFRKISESYYELHHVCLPMSVCPHWTTGLPLNRFSWNLIFEDFSKSCRENSNFIKIWQ